MRKLASVMLFLLLLVLILLVWPLFREEPQNVRVRSDTFLTVFGNCWENMDSHGTIEGILENFMTENPRIAVLYEGMKGNEYYNVLAARSRSGRLDDVFFVNHDYAVSLTREGRLADLSGLNRTEGFRPSVMRYMCKTDGKLHWVPLTITVFGLYVNVGLLEANGLDIPTTLTGWETICRFFADKGVLPVVANRDISLKAMIVGRALHGLYEEHRERDVLRSVSLGRTGLGDLLMPGLELAEKFIRNGWIDAQAALRTQRASDDLTAFAWGQSPFMLTGAWEADRLKKLGPGFSFAVTPYPIRDDGWVLVGNLDMRLAAAAGGRHAKEAEKIPELAC